jgi:hypothetical protein
VSLSQAEKALPIFACLAAQPGEATGFACACQACQAAWKPLAAPGPGPAPANAPANAPADAPADIPGDSTSTSTIALGTPITGVLEVDGDHDWYAVNLVAGTRYQITLNGVAVDGYGALEDPYLYLRNADGILIAQNDDIRNGVLRNSRLNWIAPETGQYFLDAGAWDERFVGGYQLSIIEFIPPTYTLDEIADFLTTGFWGDGGRNWDISADNVITYNVMGLTSAGQTLARAAFASWANVTNLVFEEVTSGGNITLDDNQSGAFAWSSVSNGFITSASINIGIGWLNSYGTAIDSYSFQTYVHELIIFMRTTSGPIRSCRISTSGKRALAPIVWLWGQAWPISSQCITSMARIRHSIQATMSMAGMRLPVRFMISRITPTRRPSPSMTRAGLIRWMLQATQRTRSSI